MGPMKAEMGPDDAKAVESSPVRAEMDLLHLQAGDLAKRLEDLIDQLEPVLAPRLVDEPENISSTYAKVPDSVAQLTAVGDRPSILVGELRDLRVQLIGIEARLGVTRGRLQI